MLKEYKFKNCYIEEIIIPVEFDYSLLFMLPHFGKIILDNRMQECYKKIQNNELEYGKIVVNENDFFCFTPNKSDTYFHFILLIKRGANKVFDSYKLYFFKLINNKKFVDLIKEIVLKNNLKQFNSWDDKKLKKSPSLILAKKKPKTISSIDKKFNIPYNFYKILFTAIDWEIEFLKNNFIDILSQDLSYDMFFNCVPYLIRDKKRAMFDIKLFLNQDTSLTDIKNNFLAIEYLQKKYSQKYNNRKIDFDNYYKLFQLDDKTKLRDWEKADEIFGLTGQEDFIKCPSKIEERRRRDRIKTLRKRYREYFNIR